MEIKKIKQLAELMKEAGLTALEITEGDNSQRLERGASAPNGEAPAQSRSAHAPEAPVEAEGTVITSPTVGVFYAAPSPDSKPFVQVGDRIRQGDTLCIIEAMKLMNEIPAELDGTVAEVCAENGQVVEYGQPLFRIV